MKNSNYISEYKNVDLSTRPLATRPEELVSRLFEKSCVLLQNSLTALESPDEEFFQQSSLHAIQILLSLRFVLDISKDDDFSMSLYETYTAIAASLIRGRKNKDKESLYKIYLALDELREAWQTFSKTPP